MPATAAIAGIYFVKQLLYPARATLTHDLLRKDWMQAVAMQRGTEVLAVQTIRNSLMSCTMTATTATLAFMAGVTMLHNATPGGLRQIDFLETFEHPMYWSALCVLVMLAMSFITSMLAARYWHHAGFVAGMPVESEERKHWQPHGIVCLTRAGRYYALSLRLMMWAAPVLLSGVVPWAGLIAAFVLLAVLSVRVDRQVQ